MSRTLDLVAAMLADEALPPLRVSDIVNGRHPVPSGRVRVHALRRGSVLVTEPVDATAVDWGRLLPEDRVELLDPNPSMETPCDPCSSTRP